VKLVASTAAKIWFSDGSERQALTYPGSAPAALFTCGLAAFQRGYSAHFSTSHTDIGAILLDGRHAIAFSTQSASGLTSRGNEFHVLRVA